MPVPKKDKLRHQDSDQEMEEQKKREDIDHRIDQDFFSTFDLHVQKLAKNAERTIRELKHQA